MEKKDLHLVGQTEFLRTIEGMLKYIEKDTDDKKVVIVFAYDGNAGQMLNGVVASDKDLAANVLLACVAQNNDFVLRIKEFANYIYIEEIEDDDECE